MQRTGCPKLKQPQPALLGSEKVCACATCHVHVRSGAEFLAVANDEEEDQLDDAWGLDAHSRLSCCIKVKGASLVIELPLYTKNHAREK